VKRRCDKCNKAATHHSVEIIKGRKIEKHLCDECAAEEGLAIKSVHTPINELLTNFVKLQTGAAAGQTGLVPAKQELTCPECGLTFSGFREQSLLGCPTCYREFEPALGPLLERAHEGGTHHVGKVPRRAGQTEHRQQHLLRLRKRLDEAVTAENYELAAKLRDQISQWEEQAP
jgi:protein arginine kinase activator